MRPPCESCFRVLELAVPHLRVMLSLEGQGEHDMSKHHAIYMRVSTKRQDTASQEPELALGAIARRRFLLVSRHL